MGHVKTIGLTFVLLLIGCTTAQDEGNLAETPASQPGTAQPETTDYKEEASTASPLDMGVAAVEIATGEKRWVDDIQPSTLDAIPYTSPNDVYEIQQTDDRVVLKTDSGVTGLNLSGEQVFVGWLPDSSAFVVLSNATGPEDWQTYELYLVSAENPAQIEPLTAHSNIAYAHIAPNGQTIAFTSNANSDHIDAYQLYTLDLATKAVTQLTEREAASPRWSPSGEWIAFSSYEARRDLFMVRPDGSHLTRLTTSLADEWGVRWSDDGASVLFLSEKTVYQPSYQTQETYRAENTFSKLTLRDHQQQVADLLRGAPFSFSVDIGNNRVELMVPTEQAWQLFIADANFELPESVVVLFAHEAGFDAPPANLNTPDDIYLARRQFPPTVVAGVGFSYTRVVVEDGCVLLRNEWTEELDTLIVPPHLFLHADSDALVLLSSEGDVVAVIGQTPVGGGSELNWDRLPPLQTPMPDHCRVGNPIYTTEFLLGEAITLPNDSDHYAADLINRRWLWQQTVLADSDTIPTPATADFTPWLKFTSKPAAGDVGGETLEGNMGCNSFSGGFLANIKGFMQIRIDTQTVETCQAEQTDSETLWLSLVPRIVSFKIEAGLLYLQTDEGDTLVFADGGS